MEYVEVQRIAKRAMQRARAEIRPGMRLTGIRQLCEDEMRRLGANSFWYYGVGAFCFAGDETAVSVSGRQYHTSDRVIAADDVVTIDLSPQVGDTWGDFARTIVLEGGRVVETPADIARGEWKSGLLLEERLHAELLRFVTTDTTFHQLYAHMNAVIREAGFVNLDFLGNLGHSIVRSRDARVYIERGNHARLAEAGLFTFEPHIGLPGSAYGFKREDIYRFEAGRLAAL